MPPPHSSPMQLDRAYTLTRLNKFLGMIQDFSESMSHMTSFTSIMHVAIAATTLLKHSSTIPKTTFTRPDVREEMECFKSRVKEVDDVLHTIGKHVSRLADDMSECKTSALYHIRCFFRDVEKNVVLFTPSASFGSMLVIAR